MLGPLLSDNEYGQLEELLSERAVNRASRCLGVDRGDEFDEFEALGLGRHRGTEEWLPDYKEDWLDDDDAT